MPQCSENTSKKIKYIHLSQGPGESGWQETGRDPQLPSRLISSRLLPNHLLSGFCGWISTGFIQEW